MRTNTEMLADFDDPINAETPVNEVDSTTNSVRERLRLEALLDVRELGMGIPATYDGTTPVHIIGLTNEKVVCYNDSTGVLNAVTDLSKLVITTI